MSEIRPQMMNCEEHNMKETLNTLFAIVSAIAMTAGVQANLE